MATLIEKLLCPSVSKGEEAHVEVAELKTHFAFFVTETKKALSEQQEQIKELTAMLNGINDKIESLAKLDVIRAKQLEALSLVDQSLRGRLKDLEEAPEKIDPEVTGVTLDKSCVEFFTSTIEREYKDDKLIQAQRRFSNRLLRLLWKAIGSKTDLAISEELLKAEKWNKVLRKRFAQHNKEVRNGNT